jgi:hypothetical protein
MRWRAKAINAPAGARADLDALGAGDAGPLRVGTYQSVSAQVLPTPSAALRRRPKVDVRLMESTDDATYPGLPSAVVGVVEPGPQAVE